MDTLGGHWEAAWPHCLRFVERSASLPGALGGSLLCKCNRRNGRDPGGAPRAAMALQASNAGRLLVQIGAHRHEGGHDPSPGLIQAGWSAILFEPMPSSAKALRDKYHSSANVRVVEAAVCTNATQTFARLWSLNLTKNLGSNESDVRCMGARLPTVIVSLSKRHLLKHQMPYSPTMCARCSKHVGRKLPPTCIRHAVDANLQADRVPCSNVARQMPAGRRYPDVLVVDAEGSDDMIVRQYFESGLEPPRHLVYEQNHLTPKRRWAIA